MSRLIILLLLAIPIVELWLLIEVGSAIGGFTTVLLVIATAVIGGLIARKQGFDVFLKMRARQAAGKPIIAEIVDAVALLFSGIMLLFPGLLTDTLGFLLLIPAVRGNIRSSLVGAFMKRSAKRYQNTTENTYYTYEDYPAPDESAEKIIEIDTTKQ